VLFKVLVEAGGERQVLYEKQWNERRWLEERISLAKFAGQRVRIVFITDVGPADNSYSDWACWGEPRIESEKPKIRLALTQRLPAQAMVAPPQGEAFRAGDVGIAVAGELRFQTAGVNPGAPYTSYVYVNGFLLGETPGSQSDTEWSGAVVPLTAEALASLRPINVVEFRNPGGDCFKVREVYLALTLDRGQHVSSWVTEGPFTSDTGWLYAEGAGVPLGEPLDIDVALAH